MITKLIGELVEYGCQNGLVVEDDRIYITNRLLEFFGLTDYDFEISSDTACTKKQCRELVDILEEMMSYSLGNGILSEDTQTNRDLFDTKIMGLLTPQPSVVRSEFWKQYEKSPEQATEYFYKLSRASNYIRTDRIAKDEKWICETEYGPIDITINLSKPEKDPRDIVKAGQSKSSGMTGYTACGNLCEDGDVKACEFESNDEVPGIIDKVNEFKEKNPEWKKLTYIPKSYIRTKSEKEAKKFIYKYDIPVMAVVKVSKFWFGEGYHAMALYGWKNDDTAIMQNSWGEDSNAKIIELDFDDIKEFWLINPFSLNLVSKVSKVVIAIGCVLNKISSISVLATGAVQAQIACITSCSASGKRRIISFILSLLYTCSVTFILQP